MPVYIKSLIIAVVIGVAGFWVVSKIALSSPPPPPNTKNTETVFLVRAHTVDVGAKRPLLFLIGEVEARDYAVLTAPVEVEVLGIAAREGDRFVKGQQLVRFDLREQELSAQVQEADWESVAVQLEALRRNRRADQERLAEVEKLLAIAENDYVRNQELLQKGVVTHTQVENAEQVLSQRRLELVALDNQVANYATDIRRNEQQQTAIQAQLAQTRLLIERGEMRAPFAGRVARVHVAVGARPSRGAPLLEIFDPLRLRLRVALPQRYRMALSDGAVEALLRNNDNTLTLAFDRFEPRVNPGDSSIDVFFKLPADDWVLGAVHNVALNLPAQEDVLLVPPDAIYQDNLVYRIGEDNRVQAVVCHHAGIGYSDNITMALLQCSDLYDGDRIVANQFPNLISGALVSVVAQP